MDLVSEDIVRLIDDASSSADAEKRRKDEGGITRATAREMTSRGGSGILVLQISFRLCNRLHAYFSPAPARCASLAAKGPPFSFFNRPRSAGGEGKRRRKNGNEGTVQRLPRCLSTNADSFSVPRVSVHEAAGNTNAGSYASCAIDLSLLLRPLFDRSWTLETRIDGEP